MRSTICLCYDVLKEEVVLIFIEISWWNEWNIFHIFSFLQCLHSHEQYEKLNKKLGGDTMNSPVLDFQNLVTKSATIAQHKDYILHFCSRKVVQFCCIVFMMVGQKVLLWELYDLGRSFFHIKHVIRSQFCFPRYSEFLI